VVLGDQQLIVMIPQFILKKLEVLMDGGAMTRPTSNDSGRHAHSITMN